MEYLKLGELCTNVIDCPHSTPKWLDDGITVIRNYNLNNGHFDFSKASFVDEATYLDRTKRAKPEPEDIVISREAPMGTVAIVPQKLKCCLGQRLVLLKVKKKKCSPCYLLYVLMSEYVQIQIRRVDVTGSTVSNLNIPDLKELRIPVCDRMYQDKIASLLVLLDKKILVNNKINDNLLQMAYGTYMHLFFGKKTNGKFNDIIVENSKSGIQVGEAKNIKGGYSFFTSGNAILEWHEYLIEGRNCFLNTGGNPDVKYYVGKAAYSTDTWCITAKNELSDYLFLLLKSIKPELNKKFFQGTGLKHLQKPLLKDRSIYIPSEGEIYSFNNTIQPLFNLISSNTRENQNLIKLRDWLLPMLMSGQATVTG
jgi:type I restriction enzyme S subunit